MITDARVLQDEFVPDEIKHRHQEINQLSRSLEPIVENEPAENTFLFGPTGSGKTCTANYTVERLREEVLDVDYQYVNCWQDYNEYTVLYRLLDGLGEAYQVHRKSTPKDELLNRLRDIGGPYVVILDEVDQLAEPRVLYDLYSIPEITVIMISNREEELFVEIDDRVASRLRGCKKIQFDKYTQNQLVSILEARVEWGLDPGAITTDQLERIANKSGGDARVAISVLRNAARDAQVDNLQSITDEIIEDAVPEAKKEIQQKNIEKLNQHQNVLFDIIDQLEPVSPGDLYESYEEKVEEPKTRRTLRNYLNKMEHYNLIQVQGNTRSREFRTI